MSLLVGVSLDGARVPLSRARIAGIARGVLAAERVRSAMLSITFVGTSRIRALNRRHLGRAGATDVIAFGFRRALPRDPVVGDVYIAPEVARAAARENGITLREEIARLVVHGVLHVLGYDHPESDRRTASRMWRRQERLVRRFLTERG